MPLKTGHHKAAAFYAIGLLSGFWMFSINLLFPLLAKEVSMSLTEIGFLTSVFSVAFIASSYLIGHVSDRTNRRRRFIVAGSLLFPLLTFLYYFAGSFTDLLILRILTGLAYAVTPLATALFTSAFADNISARMGKLNAFISFGWAMAGFTIGWLASTIGLRSSFLIAGLISLAIPLIAYLFIKDIKPEKEERPTGNRQIMPLCLAVVIRHAAAYSLWAIFPIYLTYFVSDNFFMIGSLYAVNMLFQPFFFLAIGKMAKKWDKIRLFTFGTAMSAITFFVFAAAADIYWIIAAQIMIAFAWSCFYLGASLHITETVPASQRGKAFSLLSSSFVLSQIFGSLLGGLLSDLYGMRNMIIIAGLVMLASLPVVSGLRSKTRRKAAI